MKLKTLWIQVYSFIIVTTLVVVSHLTVFTPEIKAFATQSATASATSTPQADEIDLHHLPLGDGKLSNAPKAGYVWSCQTRFGPQRGAFRDGPWINKTDGTWDATQKIEVSGAVDWPDAKFSIQVAGNIRQIRGNGLPDHLTGVFPIQPSDPAYQFDRNPNRISSQNLALNLPLNPLIAPISACVPMGMIGVLSTGVALFNALDAQGKDAEAHEVQDHCAGHPEMRGQYHYHGLGTCVPETGQPESHSDLIGYALDGFGIFGFKGENGKILTDADLDECHGHIHEIDWDGKVVTMYHYHATHEYPYTIGCFRGVPIPPPR